MKTNIIIAYGAEGLRVPASHRDDETGDTGRNSGAIL